MGLISNNKVNIIDIVASGNKDLLLQEIKNGANVEYANYLGLRHKMGIMT